MCSCCEEIDIVFENDDESPTVLTYNIIKYSDACS